MILNGISIEVIFIAFLFVFDEHFLKTLVQKADFQFTVNKP